jgi:nucleotide-binding universal stress UspA family protein
MKPRKILVGIGEAPEADDVDGVLEFAAAEAVRRQCGVHLMHAVSAGSRHGDGSELTLTGDSMQHAGADVLVNAAQRLEKLLGDELSVTTELVHDSGADALNDASPHACLVLLQRRPHPKISFGLRSVINGVAGRAAVPVILVPSTWRRDLERPSVVVVGVGDAETSGSLVGAALDSARRLGADLRLVHARPSGLRHQAEKGPEESRASAQEVADLQGEFAPMLAGHPDVRVEWLVDHGEPEDTLVVAGDTASLIVVGRHHRKHGLGPHLGSTARAVLALASCPVMVVEPGRFVEADAAADGAAVGAGG